MSICDAHNVLVIFLCVYVTMRLLCRRVLQFTSVFQINPQCNTTDLSGIMPGMNWMLYVMIFVLVFSLQASDVKSKIVNYLNLYS